jgi:aminomethyltransferase
MTTPTGSAPLPNPPALVGEGREGAEPLRTPLHALHSEAGARMVDFAGYEMPLHYRPGILKEHLHTRGLAGLFDVSHLGQFALTSVTSGITDAAQALESVLPSDILGLSERRQRYAVLPTERGGIIDDLMVARHPDRFILIVNAGRKRVDAEYLTTALGRTCKLEPLQDRALLALQGPASETVLGRLSPEVSQMRFMDLALVRLAGVSSWVTRSGYSGEDGFEISVPAQSAEAVARAILQDARATWAGLGARDSLRLEAGLCLYGSDLDEMTTPVEAALEWSIPRMRRSGGDRAAGFPGAGHILRELTEGPARRRVGLLPDGRAVIRAGTPLFAGDNDAEPVGRVTSGGFGPTVDRPIAMAYVVKAHAQVGTLLKAELRGRRLAVRVTAMPFTPHNYKR